MNTMQSTDGGVSNPAFEDDEESISSSSHEASVEEDDVFDDDPPSYKSKETDQGISEESPKP
jgi:hypothetical protein